MKLRNLLLTGALAAGLVGCADAADHASSPVANSSAAASQTQTAKTDSFEYEFDTIHTQILFFVDHIGFSKSQGEFLQFNGGFNFTPDNWADSKLEVIVDTASITMNDGEWDDHMKNEDFFNVGAYPTMTFTSTKIESADGKTGKVYGDLTILGVNKPAVLDVTFNKAGVHPFSKRYVAGFSATTHVKRSDFGMKYGIPAIGDDVEIRLEVEGMRKKTN